MSKKSLLFLLLFFSFFLTFAKPKLAVMSIDDQSGKLSEKVKTAATTLLRMHLSSSGQFIVIDATRQKKTLTKIIKQKKKESYMKCYDDKCQIPLGQALSADTILRSTVTELGGTFSLGVELIDLAKEAVTKAAGFEFDGTEKGIHEAVKKVVAQIGAISVEEQKRQAELEKQRQIEEKKIAEKKKKEEEEKRKKERLLKLKKERALKLAQEKKKKELELAYKKEMKVAGKTRKALAWTSFVSGLALSATGVGLLVYSSGLDEKWEESYGNYIQATNTEDAVKYRNEIEDYKNKEKVSKILGGVFVGTGVGFLLTSIIIGNVKTKAEKRVKKKYEISFQVDPFSRMAVLSVNY